MLSIATEILTDALANRQELRDDLEEILSERTTDEWFAHLTRGETQMPLAPTNGIEEMVENPQVDAVESVVERIRQELGEHLAPDIVPEFSRTFGAITDAPDLGDDTDAILSRSGYSEREQGKLRGRGRH